MDVLLKDPSGTTPPPTHGTAGGVELERADLLKKMDKKSAGAVWHRASHHFANQAEGEVEVITGTEIAPDGAFARVEREALARMLDIGHHAEINKCIEKGKLAMSTHRDLPHFESIESLSQSGDVRIYEVEGSKDRNAVIVELPGNPPERAIFCKKSFTGYKGVCDKAHGGNLHDDGFDADHVIAKSQVSDGEGYIRMARVESGVNRYHGSKHERRVKLQHQFSKAARGDGMSDLDSRAEGKIGGLGREFDAESKRRHNQAQPTDPVKKAGQKTADRQEKLAALDPTRRDYALFRDAESQQRIEGMMGQDITAERIKDRTTAQKIDPIASIEKATRRDRVANARKQAAQGGMAKKGPKK